MPHPNKLVLKQMSTIVWAKHLILFTFVESSNFVGLFETLTERNARHISYCLYQLKHNQKTN
jgi:hypothetical protein